MTDFGVAPLRTASVAYLDRLKESIQVDPIYQRQGEVWTKAKQRLLIDSVINKFDIPKIYFHEHARPVDVNGRRIKYSLVDGRQRLEAIWDFLAGKFALADDFILLEDGSSLAAGKTYSELVTDAPEVAALFSATSLDVMLIRTDDIELIEEMFSRLNEAVPLNAAEKRNGRGGPLRPAVRKLVAKPFFADRLPFSNKRYRHFDLATKFLFWTEQSGPADVKKQQLDVFWESIKDAPDGATKSKNLVSVASDVVDSLAGTFEHEDPLLASIGMVSVFYLLYLELILEEKKLPRRAELLQFDRDRRLRKKNDDRFDQENDLSESQQRLLEFDRLSQSPNDESALRFRLTVIRDYLKDPKKFSN